MSFHAVKKTLPMLGVGLGLRTPLFEDTMAHRDAIDWLEIVPENYMGKGGRSLQMLREALDQGFPIISHGVNLSLGSMAPFCETYLNDLQALFAVIQPAWFSDHLSFSSVGDVYLNDLIPLPFTWEAVHHVVKRIRTVQTRFDVPFLIENISYYTHFGHAELTEAQFISEILERADCGLMLDVNNVYVNAQNHGTDPAAFLNDIPLDRTVQIHIAGHLREERLIVDTHAEAVCDDVWPLLESVLRRTAVHGILLERDGNFPPFEDLLAEIHQIRQIVARVAGQPEALCP